MRYKSLYTSLYKITWWVVIYTVSLWTLFFTLAQCTFEKALLPKAPSSYLVSAPANLWRLGACDVALDSLALTEPAEPYLFEGAFFLKNLMKAYQEIPVDRCFHERVWMYDARARLDPTEVAAFQQRAIKRISAAPPPPTSYAPGLIPKTFSTDMAQRAPRDVWGNILFAAKLYGTIYSGNGAWSYLSCDYALKR